MILTSISELNQMREECMWWVLILKSNASKGGFELETLVLEGMLGGVVICWSSNIRANK